MPIIEILDASGNITNTVVADTEFAEQHYQGKWRLAEQQGEPAPLQLARHITVGAFFDRFGPAKWGILADATPTVAAVVKDASVRKYIDLDNPDLPAGLALIQQAGHGIDPADIITAPVQNSERP